MVTTNQKRITDTQKIKRKEYTHNMKESHQIRKKENKKRRKEQRRTTKTKQRNGSKYIPVNNYIRRFPGGTVVKNLLPQGTQVQALVREDPTCCGAVKPMHDNY